ncbi:MAG: electron transfer flavoprotein subunit beta/FixA family protein, partial [Syntrophorhabdaceae bacterium]
MKIIVLIKQVPDPEALVEIAASGNDLNIEPKFAMNFFDEFAVEEALRIKEKHNGAVKVISLGGPKAIEALRTAIAMGADEAALIEDEVFSKGDGYATALALSAALKKETYDIILCGRQAIDADRGEVPQMIAEFLGLPHVGIIVKLDIADGKATVESSLEGATDIIEVELPAIFTAQKGLNEPRVPLITGVMKAMKVQIPKLTLEDLGVARDTPPKT